MHFDMLTGMKLLLPIVLLAIALEIGWILLVQKRSYPWREFFATIGVYTLHLPAHLLTPLIFGPVGLLLYAHRIATIPVNTAWGLALLFLAVDFAYYWMHRNSHEIRWMWASHIVHHNIRAHSSFERGSVWVRRNCCREIGSFISRSPSSDSARLP